VFNGSVWDHHRLRELHQFDQVSGVDIIPRKKPSEHRGSSIWASYLHAWCILVRPATCHTRATLGAPLENVATVGICGIRSVLSDCCVLQHSLEERNAHSLLIHMLFGCSNTCWCMMTTMAYYHLVLLQSSLFELVMVLAIVILPHRGPLLYLFKITS
jgi:hypothetical protein